MARNTKHNNSQALLGLLGLLGPAASCPLKTCLAGRTEGGGGGGCPLKILGGERRSLSISSALSGHCTDIIDCYTVRAIQSCIYLSITEQYSPVYFSVNTCNYHVKVNLAKDQPRAEEN